MRKSLCLFLAVSFLFSGIPVTNAVQKVCSNSQLSKINKLSVEFNNNRADLQQWILLVNRSVDGLAKSYLDVDVSAEQLWSQNYDASAGWVIKLNAREKQILSSLKKAFECTGYGTVIDNKFGYIEVTGKSKVKVWPARITLKAKPTKVTPKEPIALSNVEAKKCNSLIKDRVYIKYTNLKNDNSSAQVYGLENMSECEVQTNIKFTVYCEGRNPSLVNQKLAYPVTYNGYLTFESRESKKISEDGFASNVWEQCYQVTKKNVNVVSFQQSGPDISVTFITEPKSSSVSTRKNCVVGGACPVGSIGPGGGIVFYDAGSKQPWGRYLEVAPNGWSVKFSDPKSNWCNLSTDGVDTNFLDSTSGSTPATLLSREIGKGKDNTKLMLTKCISGAAKIASDYNGGGLNDWFLPSSREFGALTQYLNGDRSYIESTKCADCTNEYSVFDTQHWTSSENDGRTALSYFFAWVYDSWSVYKSDLKYVRPVRSF